MSTRDKINGRSHTTTGNNPVKRYKHRTVFVLISMLLVSACSTNSVLVGYFYGRMDNRMYESITEYASFTKAQQLEIRESVDTFFLWHRTNEMPRYADYIEQISGEIITGDYDEERILFHLNAVRKLGQDSFRKSPIAQAAPFLEALTDTQIDEVETHIKRKDEKFNEWYVKRRETGDDARLNAIVKNVGRLGIKLNDRQKLLIKDGLSNYRGGPLQRFEVWNKWERELVSLLKNRESGEFESKVSEHLAVYQDQMRLQEPEIHAHNQRNSARIINSVLLSLTEKQKATLLKKLQQTRNSLITIASR